MARQVILGIESSCDDTGIGICINGQVVANEIMTSVPMHQKYGGVVPEIAARAHEQNILVAFNAALQKANLTTADITHIAYADLPGLPGCLHVSRIFAKTLGLCLGVPLIAVNHLYGHIFSGAINRDPLTYPSLGLVVSGGHTAIYLVKSAQDIELLAQTADDAIGEVYDKVARLLGLAYPGGPLIDKLYDARLKTSVTLLNPTKKHVAFSYSGVKTAIINYLHEHEQRHEAVNQQALASSFQYWIIHDFLNRIVPFLKKYPIKTIALGGGVSANRLLREEIQKFRVPVMLPEMQYTVDNGAMSAYYAHVLLHEVKDPKQIVYQFA